MPIRVGIECAGRRCFVSALDWPGWSRSGRDEPAALAAFEAARERFAAVVAAAGLELPVTALEVVERLPGDATTAFGAPAVVFDADRRPVTAAEAALHGAIVAAGWDALDTAVARAPAELRKGPRGGGRDRDRIAEHCVGADAAYARSIGLRVREPDPADRAAVEALRFEILEVLGAPSDGTPLAGRRWPARFAARRVAWHSLDHAWEIADRASPIAG